MAKTELIENIYSSNINNVQELIEIMEYLEHTVHGFNAVAIYDSEIEKWLINNKVACMTSRGSCVRGPKFDEIYNRVFNEFYENYM